MNVIFFTQSRSLDVFHQLLIRTKDRLGIDKSGFYVANKAHYEDFLTENPDFENQYLVLKEWEIYKEAQNHICNMDRISKYEIDIGDPTLWTPIVTDRRLYYGEKTTYRQDYKPYFNYYDQMSILDLALQRIDKFFNEKLPGSKPEDYLIRDNRQPVLRLLLIRLDLLLSGKRVAVP